MAMNGIVSASMREKGMKYRINFGLTYPLIRRIAEAYVPDAELAQYLWKEQIRESKMLATWLYPANEMTPEVAQQWVEEIPYPEIADICCMNLFVKLPFALQKASEWVMSDKEIIRYTGYQLFNRLTMQGEYPENDVESKLISSVLNLSENESATVQAAALNCMIRLIRHDRTSAERIVKAFCTVKVSETSIQKRIAGEIEQEYEFSHHELYPINNK